MHELRINKFFDLQKEFLCTKGRQTFVNKLFKKFERKTKNKHKMALIIQTQQKQHLKLLEAHPVKGRDCNQMLDYLKISFFCFSFEKYFV